MKYVKYCGKKEMKLYLNTPILTSPPPPNKGHNRHTDIPDIEKEKKANKETASIHQS